MQGGRFLAARVAKYATRAVQPAEVVEMGGTYCVKIQVGAYATRPPAV